MALTQLFNPFKSAMMSANYFSCQYYHFQTHWIIFLKSNDMNIYVSFLFPNT